MGSIAVFRDEIEDASADLVVVDEQVNDLAGLGHGEGHDCVTGLLQNVDRLGRQLCEHCLDRHGLSSVSGKGSVLTLAASSGKVNAALETSSDVTPGEIRLGT